MEVVCVDDSKLTHEYFNKIGIQLASDFKFKNGDVYIALKKVQLRHSLTYKTTDLYAIKCPVVAIDVVNDTSFTGVLLPVEFFIPLEEYNIAFNITNNLLNELNIQVEDGND